MGMELYSNVKNLVKTSNYRMCYTGEIAVHFHPDPNISVPEGADMPPVCTRQPGRPLKIRKQAFEVAVKSVTCSRCGKFGYNRASCQESTDF